MIAASSKLNIWTFFSREVSIASFSRMLMVALSFVWLGFSFCKSDDSTTAAAVAGACEMITSNSQLCNSNSFTTESGCQSNQGVYTANTTCPALGWTNCNSDGTQCLTAPVPGSKWTIRELPSAEYWSSIAYGNGIFLAAAAGHVATSPDGKIWTSQNPPTSGSFGVHYMNGIFLASGAIFATSVDGINWTTKTAPSNGGRVAYGNGTYVAMNHCVSAMTSPDLITWTTRTIPTSADCNTGFVFGNGVFVAGSTWTTSKVITSSNGITWSQNSIPFSANSWSLLGHGNGIFVWIGEADSNTNLITSTNGSTWTNRPPMPYNNSPFNMKAITYGNGVFVAINCNGCSAESRNTSWVSSNGVTWTYYSMPVSAPMVHGLAFGNGTFVSIGNSYAKTNLVATSP